MTPEERRQKIIADINAVAAQLDHEHAQARRRPELPHIPRSRSTLFWEIVLAIGLFCGPVILFGGLYLGSFIWPSLWGKDGPLSSERQLRKLPYEYIETLDVEGECAEDHVKVSAPYTGRIEHSRDVTTGTYSASGYVTLSQDYRREARMKRPRDPYRYEPSRAIGFTRLRPEDLQGDVLQLAGRSEYLEDEMSRPSYRATCTLRVIERRDHRPALQEETTR